MPKNNIILVEDDLELAQLIKVYLEKNLLQVTIINDGSKAVAAITQAQPTLVILDRMLPNIDGLTICQQLNGNYHGSIIMLTAMILDDDHIEGLTYGANDYLCKPISPKLLLARIKNLLPVAENPQQLQIPPLELNNKLKQLKLNGKLIEATDAEFNTLWQLASNVGQAVSRDKLSLATRGLEHDGKARSIDIHISKLRAKLGNSLISSVRGVGYKLVITDE